MAELRVAFALFDRDGDGAITAKELRLTMTTLGFPGDDQIVKKMIEKFDYDGELNVLELVATHSSSIVNSCVIKNELVHIFRQFFS